uniref:BTB domain-containing protein n=1 Tax=Sinocyclocheilus rhinocerous TaxID=307959 RepID=A0A673GV38_9TELE
MRERLNDTINLPCINGEILEALVSYVYTLKISITQNNVQSLLEAADLLQFNSLKKACENFLIRLLDVDNCLGMHSFAELHMCSDLQREALRIILSRFEELTLQEDPHVGPFPTHGFRAKTCLILKESYSVALLGPNIYVTGGYRTQTVDALDTVWIYNTDS